VEVVALDHLEISDVFLMKVDVEGYELPVLRGATKLLSDERLASVILELNRSGERYGFNDSEIVSLMKSFRFLPYRYDPLNRELMSLKCDKSSPDNIIFIRDYALVSERLSSGDSFHVLGKSI
jgi:hypothetical protein